MFRIYRAFIRELGLTLPRPICINLLLCNGFDLILALPRAVLIVEVCPLAEVFQLPLGTRTLCDDALDDFIGLIFLF
jgi:hypothetical protein